MFYMSHKTEPSKRQQSSISLQFDFLCFVLESLMGDLLKNKMKTEKMFDELPISDQAQVVLSDYVKHIALYRGVTAPFQKTTEDKARKKYPNLDWDSVDAIMSQCANATLHAFQFLGMPVPKKNCPIIYLTVEILNKVIETGELPQS